MNSCNAYYPHKMTNPRATVIDKDMNTLNNHLNAIYVINNSLMK